MIKINNAMTPHSLRFKEIQWYSQFSVKESVAEKFFVQERIFLAGDACHVHSVNGGQGLNTGLADAFNLIWKIKMVLKQGAAKEVLLSYENERKPVARNVIETSGELVRATKFSQTGTHAQDYVKIVEKRAGHITGMGIRYGEQGQTGSRLLDFEVYRDNIKSRLYSLLDYTRFTLLIFGEVNVDLGMSGFVLPESVKVIHIHSKILSEDYWAKESPYQNQMLLVRPDSYIQACLPLEKSETLISLSDFYNSSMGPYGCP